MSEHLVEGEALAARGLGVVIGEGLGEVLELGPGAVEVLGADLVEADDLLFYQDVVIVDGVAGIVRAVGAEVVFLGEDRVGGAPLGCRGGRVVRVSWTGVRRGNSREPWPSRVGAFAKAEDGYGDAVAGQVDDRGAIVAIFARRRDVVDEARDVWAEAVGDAELAVSLALQGVEGVDHLEIVLVPVDGPIEDVDFDGALAEDLVGAELEGQGILAAGAALDFDRVEEAVLQGAVGVTPDGLAVSARQILQGAQDQADHALPPLGGWVLDGHDVMAPVMAVEIQEGGAALRGEAQAIHAWRHGVGAGEERLDALDGEGIAAAQGDDLLSFLAGPAQAQAKEGGVIAVNGGAEAGVGADHQPRSLGGRGRRGAAHGARAGCGVALWRWGLGGGRGSRRGWDGFSLEAATAPVGEAVLHHVLAAAPSFAAIDEVTKGSALRKGLIVVTHGELDSPARGQTRQEGVVPVAIGFGDVVDDAVDERLDGIGGTVVAFEDPLEFPDVVFGARVRADGLAADDEVVAGDVGDVLRIVPGEATEVADPDVGVAEAARLFAERALAIGVGPESEGAELGDVLAAQESVAARAFDPEIVTRGGAGEDEVAVAVVDLVVYEAVDGARDVESIGDVVEVALEQIVGAVVFEALVGAEEDVAEDGGVGWIPTDKAAFVIVLRVPIDG